MLIINAEESGFSYSYTTVGAAGSDDWINILLEVGGAWTSATHTHARSLQPDVFMMFSEDPWTFHLSSLLPQWLLLTAPLPPAPLFLTHRPPPHPHLLPLHVTPPAPCASLLHQQLLTPSPLLLSCCGSRLSDQDPGQRHWYLPPPRLPPRSQAGARLLTLHLPLAPGPGFPPTPRQSAFPPARVLPAAPPRHRPLPL